MAAGFIAMGLDYFFGDPIQNHDNEEGFDRSAWFAKSRKQADDCLPNWIEAVKAKYGKPLLDGASGDILIKTLIGIVA